MEGCGRVFPPSDTRKEGGGVGSSFSRLVSSLLLLLPVLLLELLLELLLVLLLVLLLLEEVRFVRTENVGYDSKNFFEKDNDEQ